MLKGVIVFVFDYLFWTCDTLLLHHAQLSLFFIVFFFFFSLHPVKIFHLFVVLFSFFHLLLT
uniref:Uncharacterized protein n=1 Tax=Anguilla anguilla TaxID=7936 RepID=A0A0E9QCD7_ANGAN